MGTLILLAVVAFASTNLDNLFVLLALFADPSLRPSQVVAGQYAGMGTIVGLALLGSLAAVVVPAPAIGLLGLVPLGLGLARLRAGPEADPVATPGRASMTGKVVSAAVVTVANGGDNIAVYVPLLAGRSGPEITTILAVFAVLTGLWCATARTVIAHPRSGPPLRRYGRRLLPWVLIGLGLSILIDSRSYALFGPGS